MKTLGTWTRRLSAVEVSLLCVALNRYANAGVEACTSSLPYFTREAARISLNQLSPNLVERGQLICQGMIDQLVYWEEQRGENARHN